MLENIGTYEEYKNYGNYWKLLETTGNYWKLLETIGNQGKMVVPTFLAKRMCFFLSMEHMKNILKHNEKIVNALGLGSFLMKISSYEKM